MVELATFAAVFLYLVPVAIVFVLHGHPLRTRPAWEVALDFPLAVAVDLLGILVLARFMRLETAAVAARILWVAAGSAYIAARRASKGPPRLPVSPAAPPGALAGPQELRMAVISALAAVVLSLTLSRPYVIWDRLWHIPLLTSLRAQSIPFTNIYQPDMVLHYHFSGDVLAALFQTFSGGILHASLALSVAHDVVFGLFGACFGLLLAHFGLRSSVLSGAAAVAVLLTGPFTLAWGGEQRPPAGYALLNMLTMSFRPHVSLAELLILGFAGTVAVRIGASSSLPLRKTAPVLIASTALLALTDEPSIGLAGLSLFVAWLVEPEAVAPTRRTGFGILVVLFIALVGCNVLFAAALAPGTSQQKIELVPLRLAGFLNPILPLSTARAWSLLAYDVFAVLGVWAAGGMLAVFVRDRLIRIGFLFFSVLSATGILLLTIVEVNRSALESHRFGTAPLLLAPIFALLWLIRARKTIDLSRKGALPALFATVAVTLPAASTLEWLWTICPKHCYKPPYFFTQRENYYNTDCRTETGARMHEPIAPTYIAEEVWYLYAGCHPIYAPGPPSPDWQLKVRGPVTRLGAFAGLHTKMVSTDQSLPVICPTSRHADAVCAFVVAQFPCEPLGKQLLRCNLDAQARSQVLATVKENATR